VRCPPEHSARCPSTQRYRAAEAREVAARKSADEPLFDPVPNSNAAFIEAFRALRAGLYGALPSRRGGVVLVTSPCLGDGKTTCTLGLAARLAADG
jgi:Mrp family chromosome partitioning ATPase